MSFQKNYAAGIVPYFMKHGECYILIGKDRISKKCAETIFVKKGRVKVNFYNPKNFNFLEYRILDPNDVMLIQDGAHGFEVIDDLEMIEVKLGPYHSDDLIRKK